jgi:hypothetical protein
VLFRGARPGPVHPGPVRARPGRLDVAALFDADRRGLAWRFGVAVWRGGLAWLDAARDAAHGVVCGMARRFLLLSLGLGDPAIIGVFNGAI